MKQYFVVLLLSIAFVASGQDATTGQAAEFNARSITVNGKIFMQVGESVVNGPKKVRLQSDNGRAEISLGAQVSVNVTPNAGGRLLRVWKFSKVDHALPITGYQDDIDVVYVNVKAGTSFVYEDESGQVMESKSGRGRARITKEGDKLRVAFIKGNVTFERRTIASAQDVATPQTREFNAKSISVNGRIAMQVGEDTNDRRIRLESDNARADLAVGDFISVTVTPNAGGTLQKIWKRNGVEDTLIMNRFVQDANTVYISVRYGTRFVYVDESGHTMESKPGKGRARARITKVGDKLRVRFVNGNVTFGRITTA